MNSFNTAKKRRKHKGRLEAGSFLLLPHYILRSDEFGSISSWGVKLLIELAKEYKGNNNGDLSATYSMLKQRGWHSPGTLSTAVKELITKGWIEKTRQGGKNRCSLYALTWWPIDECKGKHDFPAQKAAGHDWKKTNNVVVLRTKLDEGRMNNS